MSTRIACPTCGQVLEVTAEMAGRVAKCSACAGLLRVPDATVLPVAAASPDPLEDLDDEPYYGLQDIDTSPAAPMQVSPRRVPAPRRAMPRDLLTLGERVRVVAFSVFLAAVGTGVLALALTAFRDDIANDVEKYSLNPDGWVVTRGEGGPIIREATFGDMVIAKYGKVFILVGYLIGSVFCLGVFVLGILGQRNFATRLFLKKGS